MHEHSYQPFCPLSIASEILCTRWTVLIIAEFLFGATRFSDLRRGLPGISPALLSKRLKELEQSGIIEKSSVINAPHQYHLTASGWELQPIIEGMGVWGHRWTGVEPQLQ